MIGQEGRGCYSQESNRWVTKAGMLRNVIRKYQRLDNRERRGTHTMDPVSKIGRLVA